LIAVERAAEHEGNERHFDLFFCLEDDIDAVATKKEWRVHSGAPHESFLKQYIYPLLEPHIFAANDRWPEDMPLPTITYYGKADLNTISRSGSEISTISAAPASAAKSKQKTSSPASIASSPGYSSFFLYYPPVIHLWL